MKIQDSTYQIDLAQGLPVIVNTGLDNLDFGMSISLTEDQRFLIINALKSKFNLRWCDKYKIDKQKSNNKDDGKKQFFYRYQAKRRFYNHFLTFCNAPIFSTCYPFKFRVRSHNSYDFLKLSEIREIPDFLFDFCKSKFDLSPAFPITRIDLSIDFYGDSRFLFNEEFFQNEMYGFRIKDRFSKGDPRAGTIVPFYFDKKTKKFKERSSKEFDKIYERTYYNNNSKSASQLYTYNKHEVVDNEEHNFIRYEYRRNGRKKIKGRIALPQDFYDLYKWKAVSLLNHYKCYLVDWDNINLFRYIKRNFSENDYYKWRKKYEDNSVSFLDYVSNKIKNSLNSDDEKKWKNFLRNLKSSYTYQPIQFEAFRRILNLYPDVIL